MAFENIEFEKIIGSSQSETPDSGSDARQKLDRNFEKVNVVFLPIVENLDSFNTGLGLLPALTNIIPSNILSSTWTDPSIWIDNFYLGATNNLVPDNTWYTLKDPLVIPYTGIFHLHTYIQGSVRILVFDSEGNIKQVISRDDVLPTPEGNSYLINVNKGDKVRWSNAGKSGTGIQIANMFIRNPEKLISVVNQVEKIDLDYTRKGGSIKTAKQLEDGITLLNTATKDLGFLTLGTNIIPANILASTWTDANIWIDNFYLTATNTLAPDSAWYTLKEPLVIPFTGTFTIRTYIQSNVRILVFDKIGNIKEVIRRENMTSDPAGNTYKFNAIAGDKIRWSNAGKSGGLQISDMSLKNLLDISPVNKSDSTFVNTSLNYLPKGLSLMPNIWSGDLYHGFRSVTTGNQAANETYRTTTKIKIPRGAKVRVEIPSYSAGQGANLGVYVFNDGKFVKGYGNQALNYQLVGTTGIFTFTDEFNGSDGYYIEISGRTDVLNALIYIYEGSIEISGDSVSNLIKIDRINAAYTEDANIGSLHNIRFKFRITEDLLNTNKEAVLFESNGIQIKATPSPLFQQTSTYLDSGNVEQTSYWPVLMGGLLFNGYTNAIETDQILGAFAFSVQYTGALTNEATIQNTGTAIILKENNVEVANLSFTTYSTVAALYAAIKAIANFSVDYNELETRISSELAIFPEVKLVSTFRSDTNGIGNSATPNASNEIYRDAAKLHIPYSVCNRWHEVEIVSLNNNTYVLVNGMQTKITGIPLAGESTKLIFGGHSNVLFKEIEIDTKTSRDAEVVMYYRGTNETVISEFNPLIIIWEGHGIDASPSHEVAVHTDNMDTTPDRLQLVFSMMQAKGYVPVSLYDIIDYYHNGKRLPKRCYTMMFDDYRFDNYLNLKKRSAFTRYNVKPNICTITDRTDEILFNGQPITAEKAISIGRNAGFGNVSHTRNHRNVTKFKPSTYENENLMDTYSGDSMGIDPNTIVYPYGEYNKYVFNTEKWNGMRLGIGVVVNMPNRRYRNPLHLGRLEIGLRMPINFVTVNIV